MGRSVGSGLGAHAILFGDCAKMGACRGDACHGPVLWRVSRFPVSAWGRIGPCFLHVTSRIMSLSPRFALLASLVAASLTLPAVAVEAPASPAGVTAVTLAQQAPFTGCQLRRLPGAWMGCRRWR